MAWFTLLKTIYEYKDNILFTWTNINGRATPPEGASPEQYNCSFRSTKFWRPTYLNTSKRIHVQQPVIYSNFSYHIIEYLTVTLEKKQQATGIPYTFNVLYSSTIITLKQLSTELSDQVYETKAPYHNLRDWGYRIIKLSIHVAMMYPYLVL
jgi:hypothetical protein